MAAFFGQDGVLGEFLLEGRDDHVFRTLVEFRDEVNRTLLSDLACAAKPLHDDRPGPAGDGFCNRQDV